MTWGRSAVAVTVAGLGVAAVLLGLTYAVGSGRPNAMAAGDCSVPSAGQSVARIWNEQLLDAIRRDEPAPTVHARNLFHMSAAMWDAWASVDVEASPLFYEPSPGLDISTDLEAARVDAISYAAATVLQHRYRNAVGAAETAAALDDTMRSLCGASIAAATQDVAPGSAAELGLEIARSMIDESLQDGSLEQLWYEDVEYAPVNPPLDVSVPGTEMIDPNRWQPLALEVAIAQNGLPLPSGEQTFIGSQWGRVSGFALPAGTQPGLPLDPGPPPLLGDSGSDAAFREGAVEVLRASSELQTGETTIDISPATSGDSSLGADDGPGHAKNPVTGEAYGPNMVDRGDYYRTIAEFWADGPDSETPPGHWNTLANQASDALADLDNGLRIGGTGRQINRLEWDVKLYLALNGALHDAAVAGWGAKAHYDYVRPISMIRYMGGLGQSSDPALASYHHDGLPLETDLIELVTSDSAAPGQRHEHLAGHVGEVAVRAWRGPPQDPRRQVSGVGWIRAVEWVPYQRPTFVTPAFAAYVSGHSSFSRAGADILSAFTGSPYFPGGLSEHTVPEGALLHEDGPTTDVTLQWATYGDAADEAGRSRVWGGIHVEADDIAGRLLGAQCAELAWVRAQQLFG